MSQVGRSTSWEYFSFERPLPSEFQTSDFQLDISPWLTRSGH